MLFIGKAKRCVTVALVLAGTVVVAVPAANASHDWSHSYLIVENVGENNSKDKGQVWTDSDSNNDQNVPYKSDYLHAKLLVFRTSDHAYVAIKEANCGPVNDSCGRVATEWAWVNGSNTHVWDNFHCGHDIYSGNRHTFGTGTAIYQPCTQNGDQFDRHSPQV